jgi:hypothetical protein
MSKSKSPQDLNTPVTIPKQTHNQVERLLSAREARQQQKQDLGISLRVLFLCGLPLKSMKEIYYRRSCGLFALKIFGDPEFGGIPYGQDRLVLIWVASAFVHLGCPENNTIEFLYLRDVLRTFGLPTDGLHYKTKELKKVSFEWVTLTLPSPKSSPLAEGRRVTIVKSCPCYAAASSGSETHKARKKSETQTPHTAFGSTTSGLMRFVSILFPLTSTPSKPFVPTPALSIFTSGRLGALTLLRLLSVFPSSAQVVFLPNSAVFKDRSHAKSDGASKSGRPLSNSAGPLAPIHSPAMGISS